MTDQNPKTDVAPNSNTVKDPDDWTTGEEPMTGAQASYLKTLSEQTKTEYEAGLSKAEASKRIDALRAKADLARADPADVDPVQWRGSAPVSQY